MENKETVIRTIQCIDAPLYLLLQADPCEKSIKKYMHKGECFGAFLGNEIIGIYVLQHTEPRAMEVMNIAVAEEHRNKGVGRKLLKHAISQARKEGCKVLEIGTGNSSLRQLSLYQKCGFSIHDIDIDYFKKNYDHPIFENGIECQHMIRLRRKL